MRFEVVIIGGGAAGLMCAIEAGKRGRKVLLIEHNDEVGRKIIISGGGRCNFTNLHTTHENFLSRNPHFSKSALASYPPDEFISLVRKHNISYYEKKLGQLFCRESSKQIVEMLLKECRAANVRVETNCAVRGVSKTDEKDSGERFSLETSHGDFTCPNLVIATGGLSFAKVGATDFGFRIAKQFGMKIVETRPSLVPLEFQKSVSEGFKKLAGISLDVIAIAAANPFRENILFTHSGMSGPAILQASNYWNRENVIEFDLLPERDVEKLLYENRSRKILVSNFLDAFFPERFAEAFATSELKNLPLNQLTEKQVSEFASKLNSWKVNFAKTAGYDRAEVTLGGVDTNELSSKTMESKRQKGLYFIGEVVDVTGWLGGYNFQWAWASGFACGRSV